MGYGMETKILDSGMSITSQYADTDYDTVADHLFEYNARATRGLLTKPEHDIHLFLRDDSGEVAGGIFCETYSYCMYIDMFWIADGYRNKGYGKAMIAEAENIGREMGCTFAHTSTFSYQAPHFYQQAGYEVFAVLDDYPDGIQQFFLKKKL